MNLLTIASIAALATTASAQHGGDILLATDAGRIVTGELDGTVPEFPHRVFLSELGELIPNWTDEPGFDSEAGAFSPGLRIGFDVAAALRLWDGEDFDQIPAERMRIAKAGLEVETPPADALTPGFVFGAAGATGKFHHHITFELLDPASDGIYLLELQLWAETGSPDRSDSFWIVFNQNRPEPEHEAAAAWVETVLAGCRADLDGDGSLTFFDFLMFQNLFAAGDMAADFDGDGSLTFFDFLAFQNEFAAGCP
ncbi:MAG: GC-type dockerin domain-anchored protein [Phycisphaerales bacterium JB039]